MMSALPPLRRSVQNMHRVPGAFDLIISAKFLVIALSKRKGHQLWRAQCQQQ
jgi:hypothetical protein